MSARVLIPDLKLEVASPTPAVSPAGHSSGRPFAALLAIEAAARGDRHAPSVFSRAPPTAVRPSVGRGDDPPEHADDAAGERSLPSAPKGAEVEAPSMPAKLPTVPEIPHAPVGRGLAPPGNRRPAAVTTSRRPAPTPASAPSPEPTQTLAPAGISPHAEEPVHVEAAPSVEPPLPLEASPPAEHPLPAEAPAPAEPASPVEDPPPAEPALPVEAPVQVETSDAGVSSVASSVFEGSHTESTGAAAQSLPPAPVPSNPASTPRQPRATSPVPLPPASAPDAPPRDTPVALPAVRTNVPEAPTPAAQAHTPSPGPRGRTSSPDPAPAQSIDAVASIESQAAVVSLDAKPLTTVVIPSAAASPPVSGLARTQAIDTMISAANHAVIQRASSGSIEVPELGRIAVRATSAGGSVDIDVAAARPETRAVLHASTPALTFDLQQAHISVRQLRLDSDGSSSAAWSGPGRQSAPEDMPRGREPHDSDADDPPPEIAPVGSVRIVL